MAGQHIDVRLTAPDGYHAQRSYSIASAPSGTRLEITVQRVESGEVSPFLIQEVATGDALELRGPIGEYFTWMPGETGPLFLIAGGSGIVPLMAILRTRSHGGDRTSVRLLYSSRDAEGMIYRDELERMARQGDGFLLTETLTRSRPATWDGQCRRIDREMLQEAACCLGSKASAFVCGPTPLVESVATELLSMGYPQTQIKTERFGPTGS